MIPVMPENERLRAIGLLFCVVALLGPSLFFVLGQENVPDQSDEGPPEPVLLPQLDPLKPEDSGTEEVAQRGPEKVLWYRSNQLGMALELLEDPREQQEWSLELRSNALERLKTLYYRNQARETWLLTYRNGKAFQEQYRQYGVLLENRFLMKILATFRKLVVTRPKQKACGNDFYFFITKMAL